MSYVPGRSHDVHKVGHDLSYFTEYDIIAVFLGRCAGLAEQMKTKLSKVKVYGGKTLSQVVNWATGLTCLRMDYSTTSGTSSMPSEYVLFGFGTKVTQKRARVPAQATFRVELK